MVIRETFVVFLILCLTCSSSESVHSEPEAGSTYKLPGKYHNNELCRPWFVYDSSKHQCQCFNNEHTRHLVKCTESGALLKFSNCMTYNASLNQTSVAACIYFQVEGHNVTNSRTIRLPDNVSELNDYMCGPMNRKGRVCCECSDGFGISFTAYGYQCSNCTEVTYGIPLLILIEIGPLTLFYLIVLFFRLHMTSAPMTCFILYCHCIMYYVSRNAPYVISIHNKGGFPSTLLTVVTIVYSVWSLDFLRYVIPPFCVSDKLRGNHIELLAYLFSLYPLLLILITWLLIRLYDSNCRPIIFIFRPFFHIGARLRRGWSIKNDIIDVFATFFLLSFTKLMILSLTFVRCGSILTASNISSHVTLADRCLPCYSKEHIPYVTIGYLTLFFLLMQTLVLILYPCKVFKVFASKIGLRGQLEIIITTFVEKFYGCYRDGLDGGRDMRSFAGLYFALRIVLVLTNDIGSTKVSLFYTLIFLTSTALLISFFKPYKRIVDNFSDTLVFTLLILLGLCYLCLSTNIIASIVFGFSPTVVFLFAHIWKLFKFLGILKCELIGKRLLQYMPVKFQYEPDVRSTLLPQDVNTSFGSCDNRH